MVGGFRRHSPRRVYAMRSIIARLTKENPVQRLTCVIGLEVHDRAVLLQQEVRLNVIEQQGASPAGGRAGEKGLVGRPPVRFFACGQSGPAEDRSAISDQIAVIRHVLHRVFPRAAEIRVHGTLGVNAHVSMCPLTVKCPEPKTALTPLNSGERSRVTRCRAARATQPEAEWHGGRQIHRRSTRLSS